jgi:hypothetical protein
MADMAKKPRKVKPMQTAQPTDRHRSKAMARIPEDVYDLMKELAARNSRPFSWELRLALIEHLQRNGLWPPADE